MTIQAARAGGGRRGWFLRTYLLAVGTAALIGLCIGVIWVVAGILHFHPLW
jgi:hypothetical protein